MTSLFSFRHPLVGYFEAYDDAVTALFEKTRRGPLSTTIGSLIRSGSLVLKETANEKELTFCPTCGCADAGRDRHGHLLYGSWLSYRDFEHILLALGVSGSDVERLWPEARR